MNIGIFGTGVVAQSLAEKLTSMGHKVTLGTRDKQRTIEKEGKDNFGRPAAGEWLRSHPEVRLGTYSEAAVNGELLINATNGMGTMQALELAGEENLSGKILIDISNPLDFSKGMPPTLFVSNTDSLGEQIQRKYEDVKVVKTFNTMNAYVMVNPSQLGGSSTIFICGNDDAAKARVKELLSSFGWGEKDIADLGDITGSRGMEQILPIWVRLMMTMKTPMFNFKIVKQENPGG